MSAVLDILINTDADKATAELKGLENQAKKTATATGTVERANKAANDSYKGLGGGIRNASYQITDFMVQVQGGTSVIRALSQQMPQLLAGFGMFGRAPDPDPTPVAGNDEQYHQGGTPGYGSDID